MGDPGPTAGVYTISVAAELAGVAVRSLRLYEQHGLLRPGRTSGGTRRYSQDDLRRLRRMRSGNRPGGAHRPGTPRPTSTATNPPDPGDPTHPTSGTENGTGN